MTATYRIAAGEGGAPALVELRDGGPDDAAIRVVADEALLALGHVPALIACVGEVAARHERRSVTLDLTVHRAEATRLRALDRLIERLTALDRMLRVTAAGAPRRRVTVVVRDLPPCALTALREVHYGVRAESRAARARPRVQLVLPPREERALAPLCYRCARRRACGGGPTEVMRTLDVEPLERRGADPSRLLAHFAALRQAEGIDDPRLAAFEQAVVEEVEALRGSTALPVELSVALGPRGVSRYRYILGLSERAEDRPRARAFVRRAVELLCTPEVAAAAERLVKEPDETELEQIIFGVGARRERALVKLYLRVRVGGSFARALEQAAALPDDRQGALDMVGYDLDPTRGLVATKYYLWSRVRPRVEVRGSGAPTHEAVRAGLPTELFDVYDIHQREQREQREQNEQGSAPPAEGEAGARPYAADFDLLTSGVRPVELVRLLWTAYPHPACREALSTLFADGPAVPTRLSLNRKRGGDSVNVYYLLPD